MTSLTVPRTYVRTSAPLCKPSVKCHTQPVRQPAFVRREVGWLYSSFRKQTRILKNPDFLYSLNMLSNYICRESRRLISKFEPPVRTTRSFSFDAIKVRGTIRLFHKQSMLDFKLTVYESRDTETLNSPLMTWNSISIRTRLIITSIKIRMTIPSCHVTPVSISANE